MNYIRLLVVSQHAITREKIRALVAKTEDIEFVGDAESVISLAEARPDVAVVEVSTSSPGVLRELAYVLSSAERTRIVVLSDMEDPKFVHSVLGLGVLGYVLMHSDAQRLLPGIRSVAQNRRFIDPVLGSSNALVGKPA